MPDDPYAFDQFPRGNLTFQYQRRQFWANLAQNLEAVQGREQGRDAFSLVELGTWPDGDLAEILPGVVPGCKITMVEGFVCGQPPEAPAPKRLFPVDAPALTAFNLFNGQTPLDDIADAVAVKTGWEAERAFAYTRGIFLTLVVAGVCQPLF